MRAGGPRVKVWNDSKMLQALANLQVQRANRTVRVVGRTLR